jgi:hypothetical protein
MPKSIRQFGLINGSGELLRIEVAVLLERAGLPVFALRDIEDDSVGVELRRGIAVYGTGCVVLELGNDELPGRLG